MARPPAIPSLVLVGPTAVGKSDVGHEIARRQGMGIVSADSMMVYRGMDIGTAKPTLQERSGLPYVGLDLVDPSGNFSVHDYLGAVSLGMDAYPGLAWMAVGGTGLYLRGLLLGLEGGQGEDPLLRSEAGRVLELEGFDALKAWCRHRLPAVDEMLPEGDRGNPRRWIRAVERGGGPPAGRRCIPPEVTVIGLRRERADLETRIRRRVEAMYRGGLLDEVENLRRRFPAWSRTASMAIGYAEAGNVLDGRLGMAEAVERTATRTRQYAKRQMTWFRHQLPTRWVDVGPMDDIATTAARVVSCLEKHDQID